MELATRPLINAGFALTLAAAGVNAAPVVAPLPGLPNVQARDVQLVDVSWEQVLQTALANATDIYDHLSPPDAGVQRGDHPFRPPRWRGAVHLLIARHDAQQHQRRLVLGAPFRHT